MMKLNILIYALCACLGVCVGQYVQFGQCDDNIELVENFDIERFTGIWYELQKTSSEEEHSDCSYFEISISSNDTENNNIENSDIGVTNVLDNRTVTVYYTGVNNNFLEESTGFATLELNTSRLVLNTSLFDGPQDFWILMTDYINYAVAYSCEDISATQRSVNIWVLGRTQEYPTEMVAIFIENTLDELLDIDLNSLPAIDHNDTACYVLPVIPPGESIILNGQCDENIRVEQAFNVGAFTGVWHQIYSYFTESSIGTCVRAAYSVGDGVVDVVNSQVINQTLFTITGYAAVASTDNSAKLSVILNIAPGVTVEQDLWIISTDYTGYAISYSCENLDNNQKRIYSWILSRSRELRNESQALVNEVIGSIIELNTRYYLPTSHSSEDCFFFPEPSDEPVVFRGQCDEEIPAMAPFDPTRYTGLWHNIELYPAFFQDGTCSNADYDLIDGVVYVYNTQVVNETLDTIRGTAVIASDDGSAKLLVSFPIAGTNQTTSTDYWVLDTDYENYSLVYSCTNINDDEMQVNSWKLSRTKELSPNHNSIIDNVMSDIPVLDQRYYKTVSQTEEDCFFYPTPELGKPVVFPGRCESNIAMQNFDLSLFTGTWYEVEAYPKDEQTGQCTSHTYTSVSNSQLNFVTSSVNDLFLSESNGILTTTNVNGQLTITITVDGQPILIPFWIIDTDYNNYALAYSCVERPNDFRAVYSWKLSRTKELSQANQSAIAAASANIVVFDQRYYEDVDQSDDACFYLPEIEPGQPIILPGSCDASIRVEQNFNVGQFTGVWHQIYSYFTESSIGTCVRAAYSVGDGVVDVVNSQVINQTLFTITGYASVASTDNSAKLSVILNIAPGVTVEQDLWIISTDYTGYAISYSCENLDNNQKRIYSWILSRSRELSNESQAQVNEVIGSIIELNTRYYLPTSHSSEDCFFFPEPSDQPVVFRGQCDEEIPAMAPFDPTRYTGLWHNIELYPAFFQDGTCSNADYDLIDGVVYVYNTQVVNETLDTIIGTAVIASDDGSAKLLVSFPIAGTNQTTSTDYWVLDTDYENYSLVYSCTNINDDEMQVNSWKLSRTKELSPNHNSIIDNVMSDIPVLDQRYYKTVSQTEEDCFFYPTPELGKPVVFPGRCESNIAMQNFDLSLFTGTWYEVEAYPKDEQTGQCTSHTYTSVSNSQLNFVTSSVNDLFLSESNGILTTTNVNGQLTITITVDGQSILIPFWIIDTDYNNYALAYSCVERPNDFRAVYSWKLSRTKELSQDVQSAIAAASANIVVLDQRYYEDIDQSDDACFYLPEIEPGQPIIFPGSCDASIRAVQSFNPSQYLGRWRLIETYYTEFQNGTCNEATYSEAEDGSVIVYNTEVVNRELESITGSAVLATVDGTGKLLVTFPTTNITSEYWILDTDYDSYALVYSCQNINDDRRRVWSWKMSRANELSDTANNAINRVVDSINVLNQRYYQTVDRSPAACFYFPEPDSSRNVRFRGQCDENINVVTGFQADRYLGLWYDLESYPMPFQFGTCPNAFYSLGDGVVDVYNTQVVDQRLDVIHGVAEIVGEAKLNVTFNVQGVYVSANYWVLATDYDNFALVYSCENIDEDYMSVFSWKLGRSKTLSGPSISAINNVMNNLDILDERYYVDRDQTVDGCFYYPTPEPGTPVIFPGQCDNNIAAVPAFNPGQFAAGLWHEIASYPYVGTGDCINHQFAFGTSTLLTVESSNVVNQTLSSVTNPVSLVSTDGTGRLSIQVTVEGQVQTIPFWILAIDYNDYALAYGCSNVNATFRQVYSWKLSRTRELSSAGNNAINSAMTNIDVLGNEYYQTVGQTDDECFYLPELSPTDPVTFPGQCDPNIQAMRDFDAGRYLGRWRLIETYYADFQLGTCNEATYSPGDDGSVIVYNTEVVNQQLESITGSAVLASTDGTGKLLVTFPTTNVQSEYWILDTDYESYALVYSCQNIAENRRRVWSWKMSRNNTLTESANAAINEVVDSINVLNDRYYQEVDRSDEGCFYYPTPDQSTPVVFRGQCNMSIPAYPDFDAGRYLGFWYDIQSYPAPFQTGSCNNANYTLNEDGSVRVENTQVVDQLLEVWIGRAVVDSDDGSAKLSVTFNVNGIDVTSKYWVLDTDYDNYALVYSCQNIDDETRSVFSWKLSRSPSLSGPALAAIDATMATVQVLDQQYFITRGHTESDCFYYPDNNGGDVLLRGQCIDDASVPVIDNFNVNLFAGTWHEVSRFPSDLQNGECVATEYSVSNANTFSITQTNVVNERLVTTTSQATVADNRGVISFNIDGVPFENVYILGIDYNDYALAYSCRNVNDEWKQIYSWKLSRTRSGLSNAANNAINQLVSDNIDLWEGYYRPTGQDNNACFYYPIFDTLPSFIELPGYCPDIRGVPSFNAEAYLGRWFETARYPVTAQIGQCNRAEYSLSESRVFVSNTEVNEETLFTQIGYAVVASTDGSGELSVEFVVDGVLLTANYYIIATDYINYSLVYSCVNLANGNSAVSSWKLSRSPSLSLEASANIDAAVANTRGLIEEYYLPTSQSDDDCFYIPDVGTEAPLFRGQCEDISGVVDFDIQRYLGWWHEIESYPVDGIAGECRSSNYSQVGNTYQVVDTSVLDNDGTSVVGTLITVTENGRLVKRVTGRPDQDIWVLATDYDSYALVYSCENVGEEYRRVWSAKHSRTRSLSESSQDAMTPVITNNRVLYGRFYLPVDQTDDVCFHYPSVTSGPVIIPGQCDPNIPIEQSFAVDDFAGTWYHIARYDDLGSNTCLGSTYTVDEDNGDITVLNFEVNNSEELETVEGTAVVQSTDGSAGAIALTFPNGDSENATVTTVVSIVATDYLNYGIVFNCTNVNPYQRQVRAWTLSRNRTMTTVGTEAINSLITQRQEFHQQYFKQIQQNEDCPEPSSAFLVNSSILLLLVGAIFQWLL